MKHTQREREGEHIDSQSTVDAKKIINTHTLTYAGHSKFATTLVKERNWLLAEKPVGD